MTRLIYACHALLALAASSPASAAGEVIELIPEDRASWGATNLFAPITGFFLGGPGYWYKERRIEIETTPPGANIDLFYVRSNFQKAYEQAEAPVTIVLPSRVEAGPRDSVTIRALLDGYRRKDVNVRVRSRVYELSIELEPLPNSLVAMTNVYFAGRSILTFLTKEALTFRVQNRPDGYAVVLTETGSTTHADATFEGVANTLVSGVSARQLGEDLVVTIALTDAAREASAEPRSRQAYDPVRRLHSFSVDLGTTEGGAESVLRAQAALARLGPRDVSRCALEFDSALRTQLDRAQLVRALAPSGSFTDPYLRAAVKRLGEVSADGAVTLQDGTRFDTSVPLELSAAVNQAAEARGFLALLRQFVAQLEPPAYRRPTLRGLVAPEVGSDRFDAIVDSAEIREQRCLAQRGQARAGSIRKEVRQALRR